MPPNEPAIVRFDAGSHVLKVEYDDVVILYGTVAAANAAVTVDSQVTHGLHDAVEQRITISATSGGSVHLTAGADSDPDLIAAETLSAAQERFRCIRTTVGRSDNRRNNALYSRRGDWMLEGPPEDETRLIPQTKGYQLTALGAPLQFVFRPRYYQKHKNIPDFDPSKSTVWRGSVTGWCSWWAYYNDITEADIQALVNVFDEKRLRDFGYRYIQIDDGFQQEPRGPVDHWLNWNKTRFPGGLDAYIKMIRDKGFDPALWMSVNFGDEATVKAHPDWFARDADGTAHKGPWIDWSIDATNPTALDALIRPVYQALHKKGVTYVKIDTLRHLLYDGYVHIPTDGFADKNATAETAYRTYLQTVRDELGPETFVLSCWGILPESVGLADACRLGTDGFGPATMQQYNSWNGIVWRSDPDHCDILPFREFKGTVADTIVRPVLVSMAGGILMLSDRPEVYADDRNLEGIKRSSPILFTVPGQLYDYDPRKSDLLQSLDPPRATTGSGPTTIDADQFGAACEWWQQDIDEPYERWTVLGRLAWDKPLGNTTVPFGDLGLSPTTTYAVYEFWTQHYLGEFTGAFPALAQDARTVRNYAIRAVVDHPQILSTIRHISQGAVDLDSVAWKSKECELSGHSAVVQGDRYNLTLLVPHGYTVRDAEIAGKAVAVTTTGNVGSVSFLPLKTERVSWRVRFSRSHAD
jgi:hypothetical protein